MMRKCVICEKELGKYDFITVRNGVNIHRSCAKIVGRSISLVEESPQYGEMEGDSARRDEVISALPDMKPIKIKEKLDRYVVGQEKAKKILSVAAYNHYVRSELGERGYIDKSNVLLIGPTGCGKTYLMKTLAGILNVPLAIVPATSLTEAGYVGDDVETCVEKLLNVAGGDVKKAERGIIFLDEIDKLTSETTGTARTVGGKGVQQALLPILEGTDVIINKGGAGLMGNHEKVVVNTSNILFVCGGAFPEAEEIIKKRMGGRNNIGFGFSTEIEKEPVSDNLLTHVTKDDLRTFGLIPEFLGRLPVLVSLENMTVDILKGILTEPERNIVSQYKTLFMQSGIELEFSEEALEEIAERALEKGTGARSLRDIMEEKLMDLMFEAPSHNDIEKIIITGEYVKGIGGPGIVGAPLKRASNY